MDCVPLKPLIVFAAAFLPADCNALTNWSSSVVASVSLSTVTMLVASTRKYCGGEGPGEGGGGDGEGGDGGGGDGGGDGGGRGPWFGGKVGDLEVEVVKVAEVMEVVRVAVVMEVAEVMEVVKVAEVMEVAATEVAMVAEKAVVQVEDMEILGHN